MGLFLWIVVILGLFALLKAYQYIVEEEDDKVVNEYYKSRVN